MKLTTKILLALLVLLVIIQFIKPVRNISTGTTPANIAAVYAMPENVKPLLTKACNDCHSNNTRYPWYANIQPVAWWLNSHVQEGKSELNFSEFGTYSPRKQYHKLDEAIDMIKDGHMPLSSYTLVHTDAKLTNVEKKVLMDWASSIQQTLSSRYPPDSLVRKKS